MSIDDYEQPTDPVLEKLISQDRVWLDDETPEEQERYRTAMRDTFAYKRAKLNHEAAQLGRVARLLLRRRLRQLGRR